MTFMLEEINLSAIIVT